jgi:hypothetical protein
MPAMPIPKQPEGRKVSGAELRDMYQTTLRFFWQQEKSARALRDESGRVVSIAELANYLNISERGLYKRVSRFLELLPDQEFAMGVVKRWREVFLPLNAARLHSAGRV